MENLVDRLAEIATPGHALSGDAIGEHCSHDEALTVEPHPFQLRGMG